MDKWNSCIRRADGIRRLKAKINVAGSRMCEFAGPSGEPTGPPDVFRGRAATAAVLVRGVYAQRQASGLMVDIVALKYGEVQKEKTSFLKMVV